MRLFKANQGAQSEEDRARDLRLTYIASRYRDRSDNPGGDVPPDAPDASDMPEEPDLFQ